MTNTGSIRNNLDHARAAYRFAIKNLPNPASLASGLIVVNDFEFQTPDHIQSMRVELGWAFFCRYESCLEAHFKRHSMKLTKKLSLAQWFEQNNVQVPDSLQPGLIVYRAIRNKLHHEDGASMDGSPEREIHLLPEHMEQFYELFLWCGTRVECAG